MSLQRKIVILGTGGTIAGTGQAHTSVGYRAGEIAVEQLLAPVLSPEDLSDGSYVVEQVAQLDSKDMDVPTWQRLVARCQHWLAQDDVAALVITHGTDTLEETAWFLQTVLQPVKPVVLTCAMRPSTALSADGPVNLRDAVMAAQQLGEGGVCLVAAGQVHAAKWLRKVHPYRVDAFDSGSHGPLAWVEEGRIRWVHAPAQQVEVRELQHKQALLDAVAHTGAADWPWVELVHSMAAARAEVVDALLAAGVKGLVVVATGNGSVHKALTAALQRASHRGVPVWRSTRCEQGQIVLAQGEVDLGVTDLSPVKARISLMLQLLLHSYEKNLAQQA